MCVVDRYKCLKCYAIIVVLRASYFYFYFLHIYVIVKGQSHCLFKTDHLRNVNATNGQNDAEIVLFLVCWLPA